MLLVDLSITYIFSAMLEEAYKTSSTPNTNISLLLIPFKWQHHNFGLNKPTDIKFKLLPVSNSPNFLRIYYIFSQIFQYPPTIYFPEALCPTALITTGCSSALWHRCHPGTFLCCFWVVFPVYRSPFLFFHGLFPCFARAHLLVIS